VADNVLLDLFALKEPAQQRAEAERQARWAREAAERTAEEKEKAELSRIARYAGRYLAAIMPDDPGDFDCLGYRRRYHTRGDFTFRAVSAMDDDVIAGTLQTLKRELPVGAHVPRDVDGSVPVRVARCDGGIALLVGYNLDEERDPETPDRRVA
jgi:hypothetical protein